MPAQQPGRSKQDYETPPDFLRAVEARYGRLHVDLAARDDNAKAPRWITPARDSLSVPWRVAFPRARAWLNPEYADIEPWAEKCAAETQQPGLWIFLLVPASVGSRWYRQHVHGVALVRPLATRLTFVGADDPYPKDLILAVYGFGAGFDPWDWQADLDAIEGRKAAQ